jgi:putative NIF3 family GTP cyclohydrolase 1 type 2
MFMKIDKYKRRDFLGNVVKAGAAGLLVNPVLTHFTAKDTITVAQVIDRILADVPGGKLTDTVDTLKSGSGDMVVTGIVTTMFATVAVIRSAAKINANFIIAHEPSFYNHTDDKNWVENNLVVKEKMALLEKYQISIWRFHNHWHRMKPDGILHGVLLKTGWLRYNETEKNVFDIPSQKLGMLIPHLIKTLQLPRLRYIGDPDKECKTIALLPGAAGGQRQLGLLISSNADLLIVGEANEWETPEYIRDANALGRKVSLIVLGHSLSEEPGMEWLVQWLKPKLPGMPITHIASGDTFSIAF